jgi:hypothetical protein
MMGRILKSLMPKSSPFKPARGGTGYQPEAPGNLPGAMAEASANQAGSWKKRRESREKQGPGPLHSAFLPLSFPAALFLVIFVRKLQAVVP